MKKVSKATAILKPVLIIAMLFFTVFQSAGQKIETCRQRLCTG
jgi:hypothetical protein